MQGDNLGGVVPEQTIRQTANPSGGETETPTVPGEEPGRLNVLERGDWPATVPPNAIRMRPLESDLRPRRP